MKKFYLYGNYVTMVTLYSMTKLLTHPILKHHDFLGRGTIKCDQSDVTL